MTCNARVACFVQARMSSERLPRKILQKIGNQYMIEHILDSLVYAKTLSNVVVSTTTSPADDILVDMLEERNHTYFRGSENDVLTRFADTLQSNPAEYVVRITADNPLTDPEIVDAVVNLAVTTKCDYAANHLHRTFPLGYVVEVISADTLLNIARHAQSSDDREHVTWHVYKNPQNFDTKNLSSPPDLEHPDWRLTVDTREDLELMRLIFKALYKQDTYIRYEDVVKLICKNPSLLRINSHVQQRLLNTPHHN